MREVRSLPCHFRFLLTSQLLFNLLPQLRFYSLAPLFDLFRRLLLQRELSAFDCLLLIVSHLAQNALRCLVLVLVGYRQLLDLSFQLLEHVLAVLDRRWVFLTGDGLLFGSASEP